MDFFAAQADAHSRTRALLAGYALAVALVVGAISWLIAFGYALFNTSVYSAEPYTARILGHPGVLAVTALGVLGIISVAALHRIAQLSAGGGAVALQLGASRVTRESADPKRRRLLNVVEEMAIASGVPVPEVYVLDQEPGINAFAAGFTPADAAITVTRGALERLDRAELAGVIGHEFSHLLNGDMRLNTRLAGPLFGLLVIAIVARYAFNHSGPWRWIYVVMALVAQWFNVFVLIAQGFMKVPALNALAPTQSEPPFLIAQTVVMVLFVIVGIAALRKFHPSEA